MKKRIRIIAPVLVILALVISAFAVTTPAMAEEESGGASVTITMSRTPASQYRDGTVRYTVNIKNDADVEGATNGWFTVDFTPPAADGTATGTPVTRLAEDQYIEVGESFIYNYTTNSELEVSLSHIDDGVTVARAEAELYVLYDAIEQYDGSGIQNVPVTVLDFAELGDFVWNDQDRDGIQDPGEPGIEGVTVNLWSADATTCEPIAIIDTMLTDADGYYLFDELRAGKYLVQFVLPDGDWVFTTQNVGTDDAVDSDADPVTGISDCVELAAGDSDMTIDAGMYELEEELTVSKTAVTSYNRTHLWDIDKWVETEFGHTIGAEEYPKIWLYEDGSGDETATWYVCVNYTGYEDGGFNVSGNVTIENTGELAANITDVEDVLGGTSINVNFPVSFPYELPVGQTLVGTYDEDGEFTGLNVVTVTTERDVYSANATLDWGEPDEELNDVVNIQDVSDEFGTQNLGMLDADDLSVGQVTCFNYTEDFAWADYVNPVPASWEINNTATIIETDQSASAILKINWLYEDILVEKTVVTSFNRTHFWDIDKWVETENGHVWDGDGESPKIWLYQDGSGDETATWWVCVNYTGYEDSDFNVSGTITITNNGTSDAVITLVEDYLCNELIDIEWPPGTTFPVTLAPGQTLVGTYSEDVDEKVDCYNYVDVTTEVDEYSSGQMLVSWGDPANEKDATVNIWDDSDLFDLVHLGTLSEPDSNCWSYDKPFAWTDYDAIGPYIYDNTATIVETGQNATARLVVNWEYEELCWGDETAWAYGGEEYANENWDYVNNRFWGWTNGPLGAGNYTWDIYAGAGQNDLSKGDVVGTLYVSYDGDCVTVTYEVDPGYYLGETHLWVGEDPLPEVKRGRTTVYTNAPGQFPYGEDFGFDPDDPSTWTQTEWTWSQCGFEGDIYVAAHAVVWMQVECEDVY